MDSIRWDETWHRLREWTNGQGPSERLAAQILIHEGFESLDPSHPLGGKDGGRDALCKRNGNPWIMAVYFPRGQKDYSEIEKKLIDDITSARKHSPIGLAFVTNQELRLGERQVLKNIALPLELELYHLEKITAILDNPTMAGVRKQFLAIDSGVEVPMLELQFAHTHSKEAIGNTIQLQSIVYASHEKPIPNLKQARETCGPLILPVSPLDEVNPAYMRDKEKYIRLSNIYKKVLFCLYNSSTAMAEDVRVEIEGTLSEGIHIADEPPRRPARRLLDRVSFTPYFRNHLGVIPEIEKYANKFKMSIRFGNVQPGYRSLMEEPFFLGSEKSSHLNLNVKIFANNLPKPIESSLRAEFEIIHKPSLSLKLLAF